jgi:hypothetical protein
MHGFAPLSADPAWQRGDAGRRLRLIADAYGLSEAQRAGIVPLLARRTRAVRDFLAGQAARGAEPWARLWREGSVTSGTPMPATSSSARPGGARRSSASAAAAGVPRVR